MTIEALRASVRDSLRVEREAVTFEPSNPHAACHQAASRFSTAIRVGGILADYREARFFFDRAKSCFSGTGAIEECLVDPGSANVSEAKQHAAWEAGSALAVIAADEDRMQEARILIARAAGSLNRLVLNGIIENRGRRADCFLSAGILDVLSLSEIFRHWECGPYSGEAIEMCANTPVAANLEALHTSLASGDRLRLLSGYEAFVRADNYSNGLIGGLRIVHVFFISLVLNSGVVRPAIEKLFRQTDQVAR